MRKVVRLGRVIVTGSCVEMMESEAMESWILAVLIVVVECQVVETRLNMIIRVNPISRTKWLINNEG